MIDKGATYDNVRGVFADLDDGGLTGDEALDQIRDLVGMKRTEFTRDYTVHLKVTGVVIGPLTDEVTASFDERVHAAVEYSSARDALDHAISESANGELANFYIVADTKPEGGID